MRITALQESQIRTAATLQQIAALLQSLRYEKAIVENPDADTVAPNARQLDAISTGVTALTLDVLADIG